MPPAPSRSKYFAIIYKLFPSTPRFVELLLAATAKKDGVLKKVAAGILRDPFIVRSVKRWAKL